MANTIPTDISKIHEGMAWQDITLGNHVYGPATSKLFNTGEWRTETPVLDFAKCKQCLLCAPACPDSSIPVVDGKRLDFDYMHCKGCGICAKVCPFDAIAMQAVKN